VNSINTAGLIISPSTKQVPILRFGSRLGIPAHELERKETVSYPRGPLGEGPSCFTSFGHLVGAGDERLRHLEAESLRS
jgi:hypothetical protein